MSTLLSLLNNAAKLSFGPTAGLRKDGVGSLRNRIAVSDVSHVVALVALKEEEDRPFTCLRRNSRYTFDERDDPSRRPVVKASEKEDEDHISLSLPCERTQLVQMAKS